MLPPSTSDLIGAGQGLVIAPLKVETALSGVDLAGLAGMAQNRHLSVSPGHSLAHEVTDIPRRELTSQRRP
jgi:hypothetical protein